MATRDGIAPFPITSVKSMPPQKSIALVALTLVALAIQPAAAQRTVETQQRALQEPDARRLLEAVVTTIERRFFDTEKLARLNFRKRAEEAANEIAAARDANEAAARINELLAKLETSHTQVFTPDDIEYYFIADVFSAERQPDTWAAPNMLAGTGFFTAKVDGRDHVTGVLEGSPAHAAGIRAGDEIVSVDGAPYHPVRSFKRRVGETADITLRRSKDGPAETRPIPVIAMQPAKAFDRAMQASARVIEKNGKRIGYVHVWHVRSPDALAEALADIDASRRSYRNHEGRFIRGGDFTATGARRPDQVLDALIVDNRVKIGGQASVAEQFLSVLAGPRGGYVEASGRNDRSRGPSPKSFKGRSIMLIDSGTRSAGELFAQGYKTENLGPLYGSKTPGAVSGGSIEQLPGGLILYIATSRVTMDGTVLEGLGVAPTREIPRPIPYSAGADPVLDAAIAELAGN